MRRLAAASVMLVASIAAEPEQDPGATTPLQYIPVTVLELKDSTDSPAWRFFALKTSETVMTVVVLRDDDEPVPALQLVLNATPPVPVERLHSAHFEIWAPELSHVLNKNALHAMYISGMGREHTVRLTEAQRLTLLTQSLRGPTESFAEDTEPDCRLTTDSRGAWLTAAKASLIRRFNIVRGSMGTTPGRIVLRVRIGQTGRPASVELVPSRTAALTITALRAVAGLRVPPPSEAHVDVVVACVELNPDGVAQSGKADKPEY